MVRKELCLGCGLQRSALLTPTTHFPAEMSVGSGFHAGLKLDTALLALQMWNLLNTARWREIGTDDLQTGTSGISIIVVVVVVIIIIIIIIIIRITREF